MAHPRVEEVSDSDVDMSDPSEGDIDDFAESDIIQRRVPAPSKPAAAPPPPSSASATRGPPAHPHPQFQTQQAAAAPGTYAHYRCLYPLYFDSSRSRAEGRRVPRSAAVASPLAAEIASACQQLRLSPIFEPTKLHPKDWANPGRVRLLLPATGTVRNKHHLYVLVAQHLRAHPTTEQSPGLWVRLQGAPLPDADKAYPRAAVPRGWKSGAGLVPYYSPAVTGGGVSENMFKDMMKEMQGGGGGDMASMLAAAAGGAGGGGGGGGREEKKKKDKKGKGKA